MAGDADLEIVLRWDQRRGAFDVSLRFELAAANVDDWLPPGEPLEIDLGKLEKLKADEPAYGRALTGMVLRPGEVESFFLRARDAATAGKQRLHVRLHLAAPPRFHAVRWECLRDPRTGSPIATQSDVLLSRYLSSPDWRPIPAVAKHDLRALVVVAGPQNIQEEWALAPVDVAGELDRARSALAGIHDIHELHGGTATLANLLNALDRGVDVLYLVCHGRLVNDVPALFLERPDRTADRVDGRELVERLSELERRPTIAMLSSCQSAVGDAEARSTDDGELSALGPRLAAIGVAAVVAMQGNISMTTATAFTPAFFTALAGNGIVDEAMAKARRAIMRRPDWWVPVLFSRLQSGRTYYRPAFTERQAETWENLELQISNQRITPVLGPGLISAILGSRSRIARRWVERWQMPISARDQGDLAKVAQYLRVRSAPGTVRTALQQQLRTEITERVERAAPDDPVWNLPDDLVEGRNPEPAIREVGRRLRQVDEGDPYRVMAELKADIYVTTGWTNLLQDALAERGAQPVTMTFPWNVPQPSRRSVTPTVDRPLVYHLYGRLDNPPSLVVSEDDYFAWLKAWIALRKNIPEQVGRALTAQSLLFLGYSLDDWDFRVLFHSIKSFGGAAALLSQNLHVGVQLSPESQTIEPEAAQEYLESYFGDDKISIYWGETRQFLDELRARGLMP